MLAAKQVRVSDLCHPTRAGKMGRVHRLGAIRFRRYVNVEDGGGSVTPIGAILLGIEQSQVGREMAFVVAGELRASGRAVVESTCAHDAPEYSTALTNRIVADQFRSADWT
ncbi:hypothetical protein BFL28_09670 [Sphingomonas turrisvirgatae]|uniref:Uncharacterized protein n=1 Tax=Sphingomonas turrisvirgatae TaxID=1888892 RepID=A0A1E3M0X3_9SPHN|nr:hypothetical protein BFL28_09670 [Sphingomonas turrisvirgatae]